MYTYSSFVLNRIASQVSPLFSVISNNNNKKKGWRGMEKTPSIKPCYKLVLGLVSLIFLRMYDLTVSVHSS